MQKSTKRLTRWFRNASWVAGFFAVVALVVVAMTLAHPLMGGQERSRSTTAKKAKTDSSGKKKKAITGLVADTFQESLSFKSGHSGPVRSVAFSPDGKRLASATKNGWIKVWGVPPRS